MSIRRGGIELPPGKSRFDFYYTALSFIAPEKVSFEGTGSKGLTRLGRSRYTSSCLLYKSAAG